MSKVEGRGVPPIRFKTIKTKGLQNGQFASARKERTAMIVVIGGMSSRMGIVGTHPAVFVRVANTGLTGYGK